MRSNYLYFVACAILLAGPFYSLPFVVLRSFPLLGDQGNLSQIDGMGDSSSTSLLNDGAEVSLNWHEASTPLQRRQNLLSSLGLAGPTTTNNPVRKTQKFSPDFGAPKLSLISLRKRDSQLDQLPSAGGHLIHVDEWSEFNSTTTSTAGDEGVLNSSEASGEDPIPLQRRRPLLSSLGLGGPTTTNSPVDKTQEFSPEFDAPKLSLISLKKRDSQSGELFSAGGLRSITGVDDFLSL